MQFTMQGFKLIKEFEGCSLVAYQDQRGMWTVGYGATGPGIVSGTQWTQDQADARLVKDIQSMSEYVSRYLKVVPNDNQYTAMVCFAYNVGPGNFRDSTLCALFNASKFQECADELLKWDHVAGSISAGLLRRREAERSLFLEPAEPILEPDLLPEQQNLSLC